MSLLRLFQSAACLGRRSAILMSGTGTSSRRLRTVNTCCCHVNLGAMVQHQSLASVQDQSRENAVLATLPGDFASDAAMEPESPARTQCGSSSSCICPKATRDTAVRAAPCETVVEDVYVGLTPPLERSDVTEPDESGRPPPDESGSDDEAAGLSDVRSSEQAASWWQVTAIVSVRFALSNSCSVAA